MVQRLFCLKDRQPRQIPDELDRTSHMCICRSGRLGLDAIGHMTGTHVAHKHIIYYSVDYSQLRIGIIIC